MRTRARFSAVLTLLLTSVLALGLAMPASAASVPSVRDEVGILTTSEVTQLEQVLSVKGEQYGVHLSVTLLKKLPEGRSLKAAATAAAGEAQLSEQARLTQISFLYVRHGAQAYTVLGSRAAKRISTEQTEAIWRNQIHSRFHTHNYFSGLSKGMSLLAASYVGLSQAAFTQPVPSASERETMNARGWLGVQLTAVLAGLVILISVGLTLFLRVRRSRQTEPVDIERVEE